ncbi:hypothetical protein IWX49DRAFT_30959 [Phyllosticta citricarpa]
MGSLDGHVCIRPKAPLPGAEECHRHRGSLASGQVPMAMRPRPAGREENAMNSSLRTCGIDRATSTTLRHEAMGRLCCSSSHRGRWGEQARLLRRRVEGRDLIQIQVQTTTITTLGVVLRFEYTLGRWPKGSSSAGRGLAPCAPIRASGDLLGAGSAKHKELDLIHKTPLQLHLINTTRPVSNLCRSQMPLLFRLLLRVSPLARK